MSGRIEPVSAECRFKAHHDLVGRPGANRIPQQNEDTRSGGDGYPRVDLIVVGIELDGPLSDHEARAIQAENGCFHIRNRLCSDRQERGTAAGAGQADQSFPVVGISIRGFQQFAGKKQIDAGQAGGDRMPPACHLQRCERCAARK